MTKVTLANVGSLIDSTTAANTINSNSAAVVAAIENTLSRDGTSPNTMGASIDMSSNRILNLPKPLNSAEPLRLIDAAVLNGGGTISPQVMPAGGASGQVLTKTNNGDYNTNWQTPSFTLGVGQVTSTNIAANTVVNGNLAQVPAVTLKGNSGNSTADPQDFTISGLPAMSGPDTVNDYMLIWDHTAGIFKKINTTSISTALVAGVASVDGKLGAFTTANGLETSGSNAIQLTTARRTLPTQQRFTSGTSATYTTPTNCLYIRVRMVGGGGCSGGAGSIVTGTQGGTTSFGSFTAIGGNGGTRAGSVAGGQGGQGGTGGTGTALRVKGQSGDDGGDFPSNGLVGIFMPGPAGGSSAFFGGGASRGFGVSFGNFPVPNTGGGGGGFAAQPNAGSPGGGGGGEYVEFTIPSPLSSYTYTVGVGGTNAGSSNSVSGAAGCIIVDEFYN